MRLRTLLDTYLVSLFSFFCHFIWKIQKWNLSKYNILQHLFLKFYILDKIALNFHWNNCLLNQCKQPFQRYSFLKHLASNQMVNHKKLPKTKNLLLSKIYKCCPILMKHSQKILEYELNWTKNVDSLLTINFWSWELFYRTPSKVFEKNVKGIFHVDSNLIEIRIIFATFPLKNHLNILE